MLHNQALGGERAYRAHPVTAQRSYDIIATLLRFSI